ncbi:hypothetical protein Tco_0977462, partial [Tanacetum coccineum]
MQSSLSHFDLRHIASTVSSFNNFGIKPTQVDIPENDEREETPKQPKIDEHKNAHIPAAMAKEIKEMISQEVAKAQATSLSYLTEYFDNLLRGRAKEWWNYTLATKGPDVARNFSWNEFKELFLQKARFLLEYINDQKLLMNHYVDMLRKEIRKFISAKDWKNMDELMNATLEREQETKKRERSSPKRRTEQGGSSSKKFKSNETYPRTQRPPSHVYQMITTKEAKEAPDVLPARVLFDSGADRSFVSELFSQNFIVPISQLKPPLDVEIADKYGYIKNHKKTVKNGQARTRERKSMQEFKAEARKVKPQSNSIFSGCARCGTLVDGPSCRGCAFIRKKFDEDLLAYCVENGIFKDFQDTFESSDDNIDIVNTLREPCVVNQDPGEKSSQEPPQIDHN